jgi:hypothetical protein
VLSATVAAGAMAAEPDQLQWKSSDTSMASLVEQGYRIVSVLQSDTSKKEIVSFTRTYVLQRDRSVFTCTESTLANADTFKSAHRLGCAELVQPFSPR